MNTVTETIKPYFSKTYIRKYLIYLFAISLLSLGVALIYLTFFGNAAWDAFHFNFYEKYDIPLSVINPVSSAILVSIAYLIEWKKPKLVMVVPVLLSLLFGVTVGVFIELLPDMADQHFLWNILYFIIALGVISVALNLIVYCNFSLPAIDQLCMAFAKRLKLTFGQGKILGELLAVLLATTNGIIFGFFDDYFNMGFSTIFFILFLGFFVDLVRNPLFRLFRGIPHLELYADGMIEEDINQDKLRITSRGIIINDNKILVIFMKELDFYILPGGGLENNERLEKCCYREVLEETGYKVRVHEEKVVVNEYFPDASYENHYFICKLKSKKQFTDKINLTEEEKNSGMKLIWMDKNDLLDELNNYDSTHPHGQHVMWREFLGIINSI